MKKTNVVLLAIAAVAYAVSSQPLVASTEKVPLADGWRFVKGDDPSAPDNLTQGEIVVRATAEGLESSAAKVVVVDGKGAVR